MAKPANFTALRAATCAFALVLSGSAALATPDDVSEIGGQADAKALNQAADVAQRQLRQTFTNLQFDEFELSPVKGAIYQAVAGGRMIYYAPASEHILFATIFDRNGVNLTALAQQVSTAKRLQVIDPAQALGIGPADAPTVIEFTDPDCPYCRALDKFWAAKAAEGKPVRRMIYFVSGIHPDAAAKAEHILCSANKEAAFRAIYAGSAPKVLMTCETGAAKIKADAETVRKLGIGGTPTLIIDGKLVSGFQQAELEVFLEGQNSTAHREPTTEPSHAPN
ncbi:Thiol:disulfide interchange protein DsbC [Sphingobium indicum BiD32]|uniref:Thiol:disulfide interchange protein n=1 Tax=Sphingobium indicum BiD32 TaxID=1301087 RepID=N1MHV9_9SPHN|nr:DsbC family protein [Sphingobium indicum]CCW16541.1 Thiol:disulfide interchange protein DsbC [Sphingobium indicum BiD32]